MFRLSPSSFQSVSPVLNMSTSPGQTTGRGFTEKQAVHATCHVLVRPAAASNE